MQTFKPTANNLALALTIIALQPAFAAEPAIEAAKSGAVQAELHSAERKAALDAINAQIEQIDRAVEHAPDQVSKDAAKLRLKTLKDRRAELRKVYVSAKAAELASDTRVEYEKVVAWTKSTARDVKQAVAGPEVGPGDTARAAVNPEANVALAQIALYRLNPSPDNKAEVKAALAALDEEIERLEAHAKALPKGDPRRALEKRIKALEKRENALKRDFTKARWDAVVADLKTEWSQLTD